MERPSWMAKLSNMGAATALSKSLAQDTAILRSTSECSPWVAR